MRKFTVLQDAAAATGVGTAAKLQSTPATVVVSGTFTATVDVEGTVDGTNWAVIGQLTAPGFVAVTTPFAQVRANITAYISGAVTAKVGE